MIIRVKTGNTRSKTEHPETELPLSSGLTVITSYQHLKQQLN